MSDEDDFEVRIGRIGARGSKRAKRFVTLALIAAQKAGGINRRGSSSHSRSRFGRGRAASLAANRWLTNRSRVVAVKARVVRMTGTGAPLSAHLSYLEREGVTRDGEKGRLFDAGSDHASGRGFAARCSDDRHHFRFIVSPEDAGELGDLKSFTRDLMREAERDLGTKLDWVAAEHWNTEHPHVHVLVRGKTDKHEDLVISRDYISEGLRARASELVTLELGERSEREIKRGLEREIEADRWTKLDRVLAREAGEAGLVDLRPNEDPASDPSRALKIGRMRKLERLKLAEPLGPGQWRLRADSEQVLRELGERDDIVKRLHRALGECASTDLVLSAERGEQPLVGRLVERGLDDELKGTAYAIVDCVDGKAHHVRLANLDAAGDGAPGSIVELRRFEDSRGRRRQVLAVRSDLKLEDQVTAAGATWLDRRLLDRRSVLLRDSGFGVEVAAALEHRTEHLIAQGLAKRAGQRVIFAQDLLATLRESELETVAKGVAAETGLSYRSAREGEMVVGLYRRRLALASGRFAMIDDGLGFQLVPWSPSLERHLGKRVSGVALPSGAIDWSFGRNRGPAR